MRRADVKPGAHVVLWQKGEKAEHVYDGAGKGKPYAVRWAVGAGTSASAPLWAGLIARLNQDRRGPIGLIAPHLYRHFAQLRRHRAIAPITKGSNGLFRARKGWSCCTGLGSPRGARLGAALARHVRGFELA